MIRELGAVQDAVVIGGGYVGLEATAVLTGMGRHVILRDTPPRVPARVAGEPPSRFYEHEHRARGVNVRLGVRVDCIVGDAARTVGVE